MYFRYQAELIGYESVYSNYVHTCLDRTYRQRGVITVWSLDCDYWYLAPSVSHPANLVPGLVGQSFE